MTKGIIVIGGHVQGLGITRIFGKKSEKDLKILSPFVDEINSIYEPLSLLSDDETTFARRENSFSSFRLLVYTRVCLHDWGFNV